MRMRHGGRVFTAAMLLLVLCMTGGAPAAAANPPEFVGSVPPSGTTVITAPQQITLIFSKPMNPTMTGGYVHDENGTVVSTGIKVNPDDPRRITVTLGPNLLSGWYMVMWNTALDGSDDYIMGDVTFAIA